MQEHKRNNPDELGVGLNCETGKILFRTRGRDGREFAVPIVQAASAPDLLEALKKAQILLRLLTVGQVIRAGDKEINAAGLNRWCMNEGLATGDEQLNMWDIDAAIAKAEVR